MRNTVISVRDGKHTLETTVLTRLSLWPPLCRCGAAGPSHSASPFSSSKKPAKVAQSVWGCANSLGSYYGPEITTSGFPLCNKESRH